MYSELSFNWHFRVEVTDVKYCSSRTTVVKQNSVLYQCKVRILLSFSPDQEIEQEKIGQYCCRTVTLLLQCCFILFSFWNITKLFNEISIHFQSFVTCRYKREKLIKIDKSITIVLETT